MRKVVIDFLNKQKEQILAGAIWLPEVERAEFFSDLASYWAYAQYEAMSIDADCEMQNYEEE